jgi:hypothetical protein
VVTGRWRSFGYDALTQRDKVNLDIFWLRDDSLEDAANLPDPDVIAAEIIEDLDAALAQFELIQGDLVKTGGRRGADTPVCTAPSRVAIVRGRFVAWTPRSG